VHVGNFVDFVELINFVSENQKILIHMNELVSKEYLRLEEAAINAFNDLENGRILTRAIIRPNM